MAVLRIALWKYKRTTQSWYVARVKWVF